MRPAGTSRARAIILFHNNGDGTFTDVSVKAGVSDPLGAYGFQGTFVDVDDDGWVDLVVANDSVPNFLYRNRHDGTFEDVSLISGFALTEEGRSQASMGIAVGDYNRDGKVDLYTTSFSDDYNCLYRNEGGGNFTDVTFRSDLGKPTIPFLSWGTGFLDFDNDGLLDIFVANGHVYPIVDQLDWGTTYAQRPQLFRNLDGKNFRKFRRRRAAVWRTCLRRAEPRFGDLFNDGHIDVVLNDMDSTPTLLRNVVKNGNHWITLKLVGGPKSPRDAVGAKVFVTAGGVAAASRRDQRQQLWIEFRPARSFRTGTATKIDHIEIDWPSGAKEFVSVPAIDRFFTVTEGKGVAEP